MNQIFIFVLLLAVFFTPGCSTFPPHPTHEKPPLRSLDIQKMIDNAQDRSTINIPFGEYWLTQELVIQDRKSLILTSQPGTRILVKDVNADIVSILQSEEISIKNLHLRHMNPLEEYQCHGVVIRVKDSNDILIMNCELDGCGAVGVSSWSSKNISVQNCHVHHNTFNAFYFQNCADVKIRSSVVEDNGNFIQMYDTSSLEMRDNVIRRNGGYWKGHRDYNPGLTKGP
jgi:parallel beta-helix repeat protein